MMENIQWNYCQRFNKKKSKIRKRIKRKLHQIEMLLESNGQGKI